MSLCGLLSLSPFLFFNLVVVLCCLAQSMQTPLFSEKSWLTMEVSDTPYAFTCSSLLTSPGADDYDDAVVGHILRSIPIRCLRLVTTLVTFCKCYAMSERHACPATSGQKPVICLARCLFVVRLCFCFRSPVSALVCYVWLSLLRGPSTAQCFV